MGKFKDGVKSISGLGINTFLDVASSYASKEAKEQVEHFAVEIAADAGASLIPGISGAVSSYKRMQFEKNINRIIEELKACINDIQNNFQSKTDKQQEQIDKLFGYVLEYALNEPQEDKIEFLINGFVKITMHDYITEDFVLTYYDVMEELRLVDISVLRIYSQNLYIGQGSETFHDVMEKHGLSYEQYDSVRNNLLRLGLLTTKKEVQTLGDLETLFKSISEIHKFLNIAFGKTKKRLPSLKDPKMKSKDQFQISKFGRDFIEFFLKSSQDTVQ
ncbi:hypothetical protein DX933_13250 [Ornithinibacillus gellani]|uniref:hypothetical protein n=1 Tax=Ornithinibacillus gellani TaxID=2293253 RepID=UPI000F4A7893|nr:hypothetical protein [Ornithinibacillus gellani]TQS74286.1 hypothetical protein DX933_13250 [Ornithinibacillus gellani]